MAQLGPRQARALGRDVALVEHEIDHLEHRLEALGALGGARHLEGHARVGERALGADDPLRDRRLGDEERARDLRGREPADEPQRERDARLGRQHRVTRGEHEPQQIVADVVVEGVGELAGDVARVGVAVARELHVLGIDNARVAHAVERAPLRGRHQPRARVVRYAVGRPALGVPTSASCAISRRADHA